MTDNTTLPQASDIGTSLAATIGMIFSATIAYNAIHAMHATLQQLKNSTWHTVSIAKDHYLSFDFIEYRTGDVGIHIDQYQNEIYEQKCDGFKNLCLEIKNKLVHPQNVTFYSTSPTITSSSTLYLKTITFIDQQQQLQTLNIRPLPPNDSHYIATQKQSLTSSFLLLIPVFIIFAIGGYFHHLGHYLFNPLWITISNRLIIAFYISSLMYFFIKIQLM